MAEQQLEVELTIEVDEVLPAMLQALSAFELELIVKRTLHTAGITQPVTLSLLITTDETIQGLNKQYRQQDKPTDVLSFPLLDEPLVDAPPDQVWIPLAVTHKVEGSTAVFVMPPELATNLGDIVISWPTVLRQATEAGNSATYELLYLLAHGVLHLIGYDDQSEAGYEVMVLLQRSVLQGVEQKVQAE